MIISIAKVRRLRLFFTDVNLVLIQNKKELLRDLYLEPAKTFDFEASKVPSW